MIKNPHRCVIDDAGNYVEFVLLTEQQGGNMTPYGYTLKEGETLIEAAPPSDMIKPRWAGGNWEEMATPEEVEANKPLEPMPYIDTLTEIQLAITELYEEVLSRG